jgi:thioredoxin-related protein
MVENIDQRPHRSRTQALRQILETVTNLCVISFTLVFLGTLAVNAVRSYDSNQPPKVREGLHVGAEISNLNIDLPSKQKTLLIALSTECGFCSDSIPFVEKLNRLDHPAASIITLFPEDKVSVASFLQEKQIQIDARSSVDFRTLGLQGTPAYILVDDQGKVIDLWFGKLSQKEQEDLLKGISF